VPCASVKTPKPAEMDGKGRAMAVAKIEHLTLEERGSLGERARDRTSLSAHAGWAAAEDRPDPVKLIEEQNAMRDPDLVPVRHGRMMVSPFTFYRGTARVMAADLAGTPTAGLDVQLCGDAHLSNFGVFGSPERALLFDVNDFDETLPGPFEYDVKRLAASFTIAARNNGLAKADTRAVTMATVAAYRKAMAEFAAMRTMDLWYAHLSEDDLATSIRRETKQVAKDKAAAGPQKGKKAKKEASKLARRAQKSREKAHTRDSLQALSKLGEKVDGRYRIVSMPPVVVPFRDLASIYGISPDQLQEVVSQQFREYRATLQADRRHVLEQFEIVDMARKVVGVGSVGTRAFIALLQGRDGGDPLFLQVKEATSSVLEGYLRKSRYRQPGERVVQGQRLMQAASDIFLGWSKGAEAGRHYYWRQLRDMKGAAEIEVMPIEALTFYAGICGWTLARGHARSGDPVAIATYLGTGDRFDKSITDFSERYADQNERDYEAFTDAIRTGRIAAVEGM
jgi:uncharacterized protein (DUF2252 family)